MKLLSALISNTLGQLHNNEDVLTRLFQSGCKARGTTTNSVTRYSESMTKCSFLTRKLVHLMIQAKLCCVSLLDQISNIPGDKAPCLLLLYALQCICVLIKLLLLSAIVMKNFLTWRLDLRALYAADLLFRSPSIWLTCIDKQVINVNSIFLRGEKLYSSSPAYWLSLTDSSSFAWLGTWPCPT